MEKIMAEREPNIKIRNFQKAFVCAFDEETINNEIIKIGSAKNFSDSLEQIRKTGKVASAKTLTDLPNKPIIINGYEIQQWNLTPHNPRVYALVGYVKSYDQKFSTYLVLTVQDHPYNPNDNNCIIERAKLINTLFLSQRLIDFDGLPCKDPMLWTPPEPPQKKAQKKPNTPQQGRFNG